MKGEPLSRTSTILRPVRLARLRDTRYSSSGRQRVERQQKLPPCVTNAAPLVHQLEGASLVPRICGAVQGKLAFASRYAPLDCVLAEVQWG